MQPVEYIGDVIEEAPGGFFFDMCYIMEEVTGLVIGIDDEDIGIGIQDKPDEVIIY